MAEADNIRSQLEGIKEEFSFIEESFKSINQQFQDDLTVNLQLVDEASQGLIKAFGRDLSTALNRTGAGLQKQTELINKINSGQNVAKEIEKEKLRIETDRDNLLRKVEILRRNGVILDEESLSKLQENFDFQLGSLDTTSRINDEKQKSIPIEQRLGSILKDNLDKIDKTGSLSKIFGGELGKALKTIDLLKIGFPFIVKGALDASAQAASFRKELGISVESSYELRSNMAAISFSTENSFINVERLAKGFVDLSKTTGLVADFGGRTLETFTVLNQQLGLSVEQSANLSLYARLQSEDTEQVLTNTVDTVGALIQQNGIALNTSAILRDIASASAATAVSLEKNPQLLAEAAVQARLFGSNLAQVEQIAGRLLDFEQSISAELEAELLSGRQINLEKARLAALNNDLATLSEELANNEAAIESFAKGNRIQQDAIANALGLSREELAKITLQQEFNNLSAEEFKNTYGEITYQQLQSRSVQERLADSLAKIAEIGANLGAIFGPFFDGLAAITSNAPVLYGIMGGLATRSIVAAIGSITAASFLSGPFGAALAGAAVGGLFAAINQGTQKVATLAEGGIVTQQMRPIVGEAGPEAVVPLDKFFGALDQQTRVLETIASKNTNFSIGPQKLGTGMSLYTYNL